MLGINCKKKSYLCFAVAWLRMASSELRHSVEEFRLNLDLCFFEPLIGLAVNYEKNPITLFIVNSLHITQFEYVLYTFTFDCFKCQTI